MLSVFIGDTIAARKKAQAIREDLAKKVSISYERMSSENVDIGKIDEYTHVSGLFGDTYVVVLDGIQEKTDVWEAVIERIPAFKESETHFFLIEAEVEDVDHFKKHKVSVENFTTKTADKDFGKENFVFADAVGAKDKKNAWLLYQKRLKDGAQPEELHGTLFWLFKNMQLASLPQKDSGLVPFVYSKSKKFLEIHGGEKKVTEKIQQLVQRYHDARRGGDTLESALEQFVLTL